MIPAATYESHLERLLDPAGAGPEWLAALRQRGAEAFRAQGLPTPRNEEWKYTPLRPIAEREFQAAEPGPAVFDRELPWFTEGIRIVLVNGRFDRNLSQIPSIRGLYAASLATAIHERPELVKTYLGRIAPIEQHPFAALNTALFEDGLYLHLGKGALVEPLIEIVHVSAGEGQAIAPRVLIVAEEAALAQVMETYISEGDSANLVMPVTEVFVDRGANLEHVRFQDENLNGYHIALWQVHQAGGCEYHSYNVVFGAGLGRTDQNIYLGGEGITTRLDGVVVARGSQLLDNHTRLDHAMPHCNSFEVYKQIVHEHATVVFNGKIIVHQDAQKTDAKQINQALLLSPNATIDSKPQLEIFADDVKCTHGATVGQLETLPLFYLRSRGVTKEQAEAMLVYAFAAEVLELIRTEAVREGLERALLAKLA